MNSKRKGTVAEREAASFLRDQGFTSAKRGCQFKGSPDSPDITGVPGWHLEVKRTEKFKVRNAVAQAEGDSRGGRWCILHRWNHGRWLSVLKAEDWLALVRETLPPQTISAPPPASREADTAAEPQTANEMNRKEKEMKIDELYPSRWLKAADVARPVLATIKSVTVEEVTDTEEKPILNFMGDLKPMVLNRTNSASVAELYGEDTDHWTGKQVVLFSAKVQFQSKLVDAIRIRAPKPSAAAPAPGPAPARSAPVRASKKAEELPPAEVENDDVPF